MASDKVRWGFLSTSGIGRKAHKSIELSTTSELVAVASRSLDKAQKYIDELYSSSTAGRQRPKAYGSYEELLADPTVEAVYVPLPSGLKREWVIKAAQAGKHVLAEKPFASQEDVRAMVDACRASGVVFMDGTMWVHGDRTGKMKEIIKSGVLGPVRRINTTFTFGLGDCDNIRWSKETEPLGALGDVGWYTTRATLWAMDYRLPAKVRCDAVFKREVPAELHATLWWADGASASFDNSFYLPTAQWLEVRGLNALLHVDDCFLPWTSDVLLFSNRERNHKLAYSIVKGDGSSETRVADECIQEVQLIDNFARAVRAKQPVEAWMTEPVIVQRVLDALYKSAQQGGAVVEL